jgi:hypothetical protein
MDSGQPFNGPDSASLNQHVNDLNGLVEWDSKVIQWPLGKVRERPLALSALVTLKPLVETEPAALALAGMTRH